MKVIIFILLLVFRLWMATLAKHGDMYNNWDWGETAVKSGPQRVYELPKEAWPHSRPNQPAGSILLYMASFRLNSKVDYLIKTINLKVTWFPSRVVWWWEDHGQLVSIKLPSILADFAIAWAILALGKLYGVPVMSKKIALIYLINPALWYNSSFWGQTDSLVASLALWSIIFLFQRRLSWSAIFLGLSLATKASWLPILPLYVVWWLRHHLPKLYLLALAPLIVIGLFLPFHFHGDLPLWLYNLYSQRILPGESNFATVSAFNLWHLVFGQRLVPDSFWSVNLIGAVVCGLIVAYAMVALWRRATPQKFLYWNLVIFMSVFLFASRMHERYLYPAFGLLSALGLFSSWVGGGYLVLSLTYMLNMYYGWWAPSLPQVMAWYTPTFTKMVSGVNLAVWAYVVKQRKTN